ncbi:unnamed protein product [Caenorhabditis auriculariae]|uniref:PNPLA domain-containing protein n=1 Tax=Caenorhabditis auriculariae TaxID=2777116 RepID=A0A8S1H0L2_9PELO|nr:unnamed protein product [Caenorhabditis auriculariae]
MFDLSSCTVSAEMTMAGCRPELMNLSFSGCGFLCVYHAGVAAAIKEYAPELIQNKVLGASAGSIVAAGLITGVCISHATSTILKVVAQARSRTLGPLHPEFDLLGTVRIEMKKTLPSDAYKTCTGRLIISLTRWSDHENVIVDEYTSNEDLIDAIMCSCFIPLYCGLNPPRFRGVQYMDGGMSDNQPMFDKYTVTVSPFSGESDICPPDWDSASILGMDFHGTSIRFTARNMFRLMMCLWPRTVEDLSKMCLQGFEDGLRFLTKNGLAPCIRCLTVQIEGTSGFVAPVEEKQRVLSPPASSRRRKQSSTRVRGDSECDTCCESEHMYPAEVSSVFPSIMRKPFDEAVAAENSLFHYILSFRVMRYARTALGVSKLPLDVAIVLVRNITSYLTMVTPPTWFLNRMKALLSFILTEVDIQKSRYTRFGCHVAVTEMDRIGSKIEEKETDLEMSEEAKKELEIIRERDRRSKPKKSNSGSSLYDDDSLQHVIEYSRNHDAMYEFHYLDENNKVRSIGLFNIAEESSRSPSRRVHVVPEEEEETKNESEEKDSGVSSYDTHASAQEASSGSRRDACCSPVRSFSQQDQEAASRNPTGPRTKVAQRRHTMTSMAQPNARKPTFAQIFTRDMSSDSEADGAEKLFVPSRRAWRAISDYDGEHEASDTDPTA